MSQTTYPLVSIIVPVHNGGDGLLRLVEALRNQSYDKTDYEIIIVDDGSTDASIENLPPKTARFHLVKQQQAGSYSARNRGVVHARGTILAFTDADCIPSIDWLAKGVEKLRESNASIMAGAVELVAEDPGSIIEHYDVCFGINQKFYVDEYKFGATANLFVKRKVFDSLNGFDASLYSGGDQEFCNRALQLGNETIYCDSALVKHPCRATLKELLKKTRRVARGRARAFSNPNYYFPRLLHHYPNKYFSAQYAINGWWPRLGFRSLHYYLEWHRIVSYTFERASINWRKLFSY